MSVGVTKCERQIEFGDPHVFVVVDVDVDGAIEECVTFGGGGRDVGIVCAAMHGAVVRDDVGGKDESPPRAAIGAAQVVRGLSADGRGRRLNEWRRGTESNRITIYDRK